MADEETTETNEEPQAEEAAAPEAPEAPAAEAEETPAAEGEAPPPPPEEPAAEPVEILHPKERRRRTRSAHTGEPNPQRTAEERQEERRQTRARKASLRRAERAKKREHRASSPSAAAPAPAAEERVAHNPKVRQGIVVSDKADKTITVRVDVSRRHRRYKKIVRSSKTLHAHDEKNEAHEGDLVRVIEARPLSRTKRWRLTEVLERAR